MEESLEPVQTSGSYRRSSGQPESTGIHHFDWNRASLMDIWLEFCVLCDNPDNFLVQSTSNTFMDGSTGNVVDRGLDFRRGKELQI